MAQTLGTRGDDGHNLVRNVATFRRNREAINFKGRTTKAVSVKRKAGRTRYTYDDPK